jgi:sulfide:quinone oxidoreductase
MTRSGAARASARPRVLIAGGGVAGLETLLALRALAGDRVDVTIVAPELRFINRSMAVDQPFKPRRMRGVRLQDTAAELGARWHRGALDRVEHEQRRGVTGDGDELPYDMLVLAVGARSDHEWQSEGVLTYHDGRDGPSYRLLLHQLREGRVGRLAFVKPAEPTWPLPLYDLALLTAADCAAHGRSEVELSLVTPEEEPLGIFGSPARLFMASFVRPLARASKRRPNRMSVMIRAEVSKYTSALPDAKSPGASVAAALYRYAALVPTATRVFMLA